MLKIAGHGESSTSSAKQLLSNTDNNNRPNTNCHESLQRIGSSEPIAVVKPIDESISEAIGQLREIFHNGLSKIEQEVEKVETNVRELSDVVDHYIRKRDQESGKINQVLIESKRTTDKFKKETPALNVFAAASNDLCTTGEGGVPDPLVKELPIRRINMSRVTIEVEGKPIQFRVDADANPSLVVPERIAMQVLARKYGTLDKMGQYITLGQAVVTMEYGRVKCDTPMLIIKNDPDHRECVIGNLGLRHIGLITDQNEIVPKVEAPAELPQTTHTQVGMMQCYSTTPLELEGNDSNCTSKVLSESVQPLINARGSVGVDTISSASLCKSNQFTTELGLNKNQQQQQKSQWQKSQTHYMYNKLRRQRRKVMLLESKRYQKRRGKVKSMYIPKPMYVPTAVSQGGDHGVRSSKSVTAQGKSVPGNVRSASVNVRSLIVNGKEKTVAKQTVKDLSVRTTVETVLKSQFGNNLDVVVNNKDVVLNGEDVVVNEDVAIGVDGNWREGVYWNWKRRKKLGRGASIF
ncbi:MAG: hypothetical protein GY820_03535 [Gammaproteobacteria bacterium]|nr:hypothetical protein [Gammaproteobacteria bacterium]